MNVVADHALTRLCEPWPRINGISFWIYFKIVREMDISRMSYYFGTLGPGIK